MTYLVGIDPGTHTGVALFLRGELAELRTLHPVDIAIYLQSIKPHGLSRVVFEDSRLTSHLFTTNAKAAVAKSMARKVGQVDMVCGLIVEVCERLQVPAHGISPKGKGAKVDAARFTEITGWSGPSNEHTRDAAMVAWPYRGAKA